MHVNKNNVVRIPDRYMESQHYIPAAYIVISNSGGGTVGEAVQARKPMIFLQRTNMEENQQTIEYLLKRHLCNVVTWEELNDMVITKDLIMELREQSNYRDILPNSIVFLVRISSFFPLPC